MLLLDVDNGPDQLVHQANAALYDEPFLRAARDRLRPEAPSWCGPPRARPQLVETLRSVFGEVEEQDHDVRLQDRDEHYWLYAARRRDRPG